MTALAARYRGAIAAIRRGIVGTLSGPTTITTSTTSEATAFSNQRKIDRCQNGVLWAIYDNGGASPHANYSTDDGASWVDGGEILMSTGGGPIGFENASMFIDVDDFCHLVWKQQYDNAPLTAKYLYYMRGTPNAGRTAWTWSAATAITTEIQCDYPDVVAHREGTGWVAHIVMSRAVSGNDYVRYRPVTIDSGGTITAGTVLNFGFYSNGVHKYPSIDFNHTGDGKTVAGGTPHLYCAWSAGTTGAGKGIRFRKATYSGGTWTWGTEREIDSTVYVSDSARWLNCLFDGTRVIIGGFLYDGTNSDIVLHERDAADTTTTAQVLVDNAATNVMLYTGSLTYDSSGNVYLFGRNVDEAVGSNDLVYRKWTRVGASLGAEVVVDAAVGESYVSVKRGYSNSRLEFIYTDGASSPYDVRYGGIS